MNNSINMKINDIFICTVMYFSNLGKVNIPNLFSCEGKLFLLVHKAYLENEKH